MKKLERYSSFEEMENAQEACNQRNAGPKKSKINSIKKFAELLRKNAVPGPKDKKS